MKWANAEHTGIDMFVTISGQKLPFTARADDPEDYMFCQLWRKTGGSIWLCPWMRLDHIGTYHFKGDMPAVANFVGEM